MRITLALFAISIATTPISVFVSGSAPPQLLTYENCGTDKHMFQFDFARVVPNPPILGEELKLTIGGQLNEGISGNATLNLLLDTGYNKINYFWGICDVLGYEKSDPWGEVTCPITPDQGVWEQLLDTPHMLIPRVAKIMMFRATAWDLYGRPLLCVTGTFGLAPRPRMKHLSELVNDHEHP